MAVRRKAFRRDAIWTGAGLVVLFSGLIVTLHERHPHDSCIVSKYLSGQGAAQPTPSCGFVDMVYWVGVLMLISGAILSIGAGTQAARELMRFRRLGGRLGVQLTRSIVALKVRIRTVLRPPAPSGHMAFKVRPNMNSVHSKRVTANRQSSNGSRPLAPPAAWIQVDTPALPDVRRPIDQPEIVPSSRLPSTPPAAWYPDPELTGAIRWWDGRAWGESRITVS